MNTGKSISGASGSGEGYSEPSGQDAGNAGNTVSRIFRAAALAASSAYGLPANGISRWAIEKASDQFVEEVFSKSPLGRRIMGPKVGPEDDVKNDCELSPT